MGAKDAMEASMAEPKSSQTCPKCSKIFLCGKSLYGHMRCHRERTYRGINQRLPAAKKSNSSSTNSVSDEQSASDITTERSVAAPALTKALPHWKLTAQRSRKRVPCDSAGGSSRVSYKARRDLCLTAREEMGRLASLKKTIRLTEGGRKDDEDEEDYYAGDGCNHQDVYRTNLIKLRDLEGEERKAKYGSKSSNRAINGTSQKKNIKKRMQSETKQDIGSQSYECGICGKNLTSYQALGGHQTSHRKEKACSSGPPGQAKKEEPSGPKIYPCKICYKAFKSGQALGGHQRLHYLDGVAIIPASLVARHEVAVSGGRLVLPFDLNELPPLEED